MDVAQVGRAANPNDAPSLRTPPLRRRPVAARLGVGRSALDSGPAPPAACDIGTLLTMWTLLLLLPKPARTS